MIMHRQITINRDHYMLIIDDKNMCALYTARNCSALEAFAKREQITMHIYDASDKHDMQYLSEITNQLIAADSPKKQ
jgi:hypothetical protein